MKKILCGALLVLLALTASAQKYKIVDRSARKVPSWVNSVTQDYLNVSATGSTIEDAKAAVLSSVKQQIAESIASRIVADSKLSQTDIESGDNYQHQQQLEQSIRSQTAKLPFIGELSLSKASNSYWEERYYKSQQKTEYFYAIQYPFSDFEMKKLVMEFQIYDSKLDEKLSEHENDIYEINSIEDIDKKLTDLRAFQSEFLKEDPRYSKVEALMNNYRKAYDKISLTFEQKVKGTIICTLSLSGNQISSSQKPMLKSNCATKLSSHYEGNILIINYDDFPCYAEDENYIEIRYRTGNKFLVEKVYIKLN